MDKIAIYTAIMGGYDTLRQPEHIDLTKYSYYCFTDDETVCKDTVFTPVLKPSKGAPYQLAKFIKILPHLFLPRQYSRSIWIDGSIQILQDPQTIVKPKISFFDHPNQDCVYKELVHVVEMERESAATAQSLMNSFLHEGYPLDHGQIMGGIIYRDHTDPDVIAAMRKWWKAILDWSKRDQLSWNFLAWKHAIPFNTFPVTTRMITFRSWATTRPGR